TCDDVVPAGYVISQNPAGGETVEIGSAVDLVVSTGPCPVEVPNVVGKDQSEAQNDIVSAGLTVGTIIESCSDDYPAGTVIWQDPSSGNTVPLSTPVDLIVACGPCVTIPDVYGEQLTSALSTLASYGLVVDDIISVCDNDLPVGSVAVQDPMPVTNTCILPNTTAVPVDLYVVCGPCYSVQFPYVVGNTASIAATILSSNGFNVDDIIYVCDDSAPAGYVIDQYPPSNINTPPVINTCNLDVDLVVSSGPCP
ncbi:MAG TPA: PASTA domain-containing protein, partial [Candidatus Hydrogenedens sp.]|nr:PASTA domain-containing protein [Candidatus Hydrogenedens sp.]